MLLHSRHVRMRVRINVRVRARVSVLVRVVCVCGCTCMCMCACGCVRVRRRVLRAVGGEGSVGAEAGAVLGGAVPARQVLSRPASEFK